MLLGDLLWLCSFAISRAKSTADGGPLFRLWKSNKRKCRSRSSRQVPQEIGRGANSGEILRISHKESNSPCIIPCPRSPVAICLWIRSFIKSNLRLTYFEKPSNDFRLKLEFDVTGMIPVTPAMLLSGDDLGPMRKCFADCQYHSDLNLAQIRVQNSPATISESNGMSSAVSTWAPMPSCNSVFC
jgi:hypothetical protein